MPSFVALLLVLSGFLLAGTAEAHGTRSVSIEVAEVTPGKGTLHIQAQAPDDVVGANLDAPCTTAPVADEQPGRSPQRSFRIDCNGSIADARLTVDGLGPIVTEAIVIYSFADGRSGSRVLTVSEPTFQFPRAEAGVDIAKSYVLIGVRHIFAGYDHLLFLLSLVLLLRRPRAVLAAETAFTVSHSLSFSAAALGLIHLSSSAAEACIALSLVLLSLDVCRPGPTPRPLGGAAVAFVFGAVHGLGFAGGLSEIGLPDHDVALALTGFAAGVEIGQVAFLTVALIAVSLLVRRRSFTRFEPFASTLVGGVSFYWLVERLLTCF